MIKTKSIHAPVEPNDGLRMLITRYYPRGVERTRYHIWERNFAPSVELLKKYKNKKITWGVFTREFNSQMKNNSKCMSRIEFFRELQKRNKDNTVTLLCHEKEGENCHRYIVRDLIEKKTHKQS